MGWVQNLKEPLKNVISSEEKKRNLNKLKIL